MNRFISYSVILFTLFIFSCKDKNAFTISGTISNPGSLKKVFLLAADSTQIAVVDSTNLSEDGKFSFKHSTPYANLFKIRAGSSVFDLIIKNGDAIDFSTNMKDNSHDYNVSGSDESQKIKKFNTISNFYVNKSTKITDEFQEKSQALGKESDSLMKVYRPLFMKNMHDYSIAALSFAIENKYSLAGFYAIATLDPNTYEHQLIGYAEVIKGEFKDNPGVQQFIKQMMEIEPISIDHIAPNFTIQGIDGKPVSLSDFKGKYVMLDFWASWCAPCRQENPNVVKQYAIYKHLGLNILGISLDEDKDKWVQAVKADKLTWNHGSDLKNFEGPTERLYHVQAIPSNFIINPDGVIIAKNVTGTDLEEFLNKTFNKSQQNVKIK